MEAGSGEGRRRCSHRAASEVLAAAVLGIGVSKAGAGGSRAGGQRAGVWYRKGFGSRQREQRTVGALELDRSEG